MKIIVRELARSTTTITTCDQEPIHAPNAIQPHGALLVADVDSRLVTHASANLEEFLGRAPSWAIGRPLEAVIGKAVLPVFAGEAGDGAGSIGEFIAVPGIGGGMLNLQAHRNGPHVVIDLQPALVVAGRPIPAIHSVLETFMNATTRVQLCEFAVDGLRTVSGFDRVMAYRFGTNGDGEIIAESKIEALGSLLGMTYPAADIPPQARQLFLRNRVGAIADFDYRPVPLLVAADYDDSSPLDLSLSALRGVSPIHCQYMRNMNVGSSLTISLVHRDKLWGMLVCHHHAPRVTGPELRSVAKLVGQVLSMLIGRLAEAEAYVDRVAHQGSLQAISDAIGSGRPLLDGLIQAVPALLNIVDAGGVIVRVAGQVSGFGDLPPPATQADALALLDLLANGGIFALDDLAARHPELIDCAAAGSGALIMPFGPTCDDAIVWFRPELKRNIMWGGDPAKHHSIDAVTGRLTPRGSFEVWNETTSGRSVPWREADLAIVGDVLGVIKADIAARASAGLARLRNFDPLTGLSNRRRIEERLNDAAVSGPRGTRIAVLFLDLDRFKAVNDSMGHAVGDMLLVQVAERLLAVTGSTHVVSRLGGDEFVVLVYNLDGQGVGELVETIRRALEMPFNLSGHSAHVSASIGVAMGDEVGTLDILQAADMAMYEAKQSGGNRAATFQQSLHDYAVRKFELDHDLRTAVNSTEQLVLVYQPLYDIRDPEFSVLGFEALLRWQHPRLGWISPDMFIPLAERSGFIVKLGDWIIVTAIRQAKAMRDINADLLMTINISVLQLAEPGFCERLARILADVNLPASAICLEVTESMISDKSIAAVLRDVRALGAKIAIDDFGTGYSSLSYLRRLPADIVKLDCSFLDEAETGSQDADFVAAIVAMIHVAGMSVIQEGVETEAQCAAALESGADMVQGFKFGRPLLAPDAMKIVRRARVAPPAPGSVEQASVLPRRSTAYSRVVH